LPFYGYKTVIAQTSLPCFKLDFIGIRKKLVAYTIEDGSCTFFAAYKTEMDLSTTGVPKTDG